MKKFLDRRNKVRRAIVKQKLGALLVTNSFNVRYLTNFTGGAAYLLIQPEGDTILSDPRFTIQIEEECPGLDAVIRPRSESTATTLQKLLGKTTAGKLGIEAETMTLAQHERLQNLAHWQLIPTKGIVEELRQVKDKDEIALIRHAIDIAAFAFGTVRKNFPSLTNESDVGLMLDYHLREQGAEDRSFPTIIGAGARAALPHAAPSRQEIAGQSHVLLDWGCIVNGYISDLTRVLILDPNNKKLKTVYETVLKAQEASIAAIKPGKTCEEIDTVARNIIKDAGFGKHFDHGLGHSIGLQVHENPRFAKGDKTVLKAGMVLTVEPGIYLQGWGGVRIEDDILVTKSGCEVLSRHVPKSFEAMVGDPSKIFHA
jgi:Xaa-Pro aminopeptidase